MQKAILRLGVFVGVLFSASAVQAQTTRTLCASGCTNTLTEANLQSAINASAGGDTILLQEGVTLDVSLTLPSHTGASMVVIRTGVTATGTTIASSQFPAANIRMTPALAASGNLTTLRAKSNNVAAIRTSDSIASGGYWHLKWLNITGNTYGGGELVRLGNDSNSVQTSVANIPANFTLEQNYIHGNAVSGQFRGISIHANSVTVKDNHISDIKSIGEGQVIFGNSHTIAPTITNNTIDGGTEGVLWGGSGGCCRPTGITVNSSGRTVSGATLSAFTDLHVGQGLTLQVAGVEQFTEIASCGTSVAGASCTSATVTWTPALTAVPDTPGVASWGPTPSGLTFTKNLVTRPIAWRNPFVPTPQGVTATAAETGGLLPAGTYAYRVVARHPAAVGTTARSSASVQTTPVTISGSTGAVTISWTAVTNATQYYVYGRTPGGQATRWVVTAPTTTYTDVGDTGTAEAVPTSAGSTWQVKNSFEMKHMDTATIEGNVIENSWADGQSGYCVLFTPANTGNGNDSTRMRNITFRYNIIRNCAGLMQITGRDVSTNNQPSARTINISATHNLAYNIGTEWGASVMTLLVGSRSTFAAYAQGSHLMGPLNVTFDHNTFYQSSGAAMVYFDLYKGNEKPAENFIWRNNIGVANLSTSGNSGGLTGNNSCRTATTGGVACWTMHTTGTSVWENNVTAGEACSLMPGGTAENFCPATNTALLANFVNPSAGDFNLTPASPYNNLATDGTDIGVNMALVTPLTNIAMSGDNTGGTPVVPPTITTTSVTAISQVGNAYSAPLAGVCPATPCTWSSTGTLPANTTINTTTNTTAVLSGTPLTSGVFTFAIVLTDTGGRAASREFTVAITDVPVAEAPNRPRLGYQDCGTIASPTQPAEIRIGEPMNQCDRWFDTVNRRWYTVASTDPVVFTPDATSTPTVGNVRASISIHVPATASSSWTQPLAETELLGTSSKRLQFDSTPFSSLRLAFRVQGSSASPNTPICYAKYSFDDTIWTAITGTSVSLTSPGSKVSPWTEIPAAALSESAIWSVWCSGGDGTNTVAVGNAAVQFR